MLAHYGVAAYVTGATSMDLFADVALAVVVDIVVGVLDASACRVFGERDLLCRAVEFPLYNLYATELTYFVLIIVISTVVLVSMFHSL